MTFDSAAERTFKGDRSSHEINVVVSLEVVPRFLLVDDEGGNENDILGVSMLILFGLTIKKPGYEHLYETI